MTEAEKERAADDRRMSASYWQDHAKRGGPLKPLGKPCHDCAVEWGFYKEFSDDLARQPAAIREAVCANWFCHNHGNRACAGNIANVRAHLREETGND